MGKQDISLTQRYTFIFYQDGEPERGVYGGHLWAKCSRQVLTHASTGLAVIEIVPRGPETPLGPGWNSHLHRVQENRPHANSIFRQGNPQAKALSISNSRDDIHLGSGLCRRNLWFKKKNMCLPIWWVNKQVQIHLMTKQKIRLPPCASHQTSTRGTKMNRTFFLWPGSWNEFVNSFRAKFASVSLFSYVVENFHQT